MASLPLVQSKPNAVGRKTKGKFLQQDAMLEKLARWKTERALEREQADNGKRALQATNSAKRHPLKEARQIPQAHYACTMKKDESSAANKSLNTQAIDNVAVSGRVTSNKKRSDSNAPGKKSPPQEMSMREKLELWRAQKQQSAKKHKNSLSLQSNSSVKKEAPSRSFTHITPSSKTLLPPKPSENVTETSISATPKKCLFKTPTSVKGGACKSDNLNTSRPKTPGADLPQDWIKADEGKSSITESHHMGYPDVHKHGSHLPVKQNSPTQEETSRKRKVVSFTGNTTPVRCSPRLKKQRQSTGVVGHSQAAEISTPKQWQDKNLDIQQRLEHWLASKGKTPSRYSHLLNFKKTPADLIRHKIASRRATSTAPPVWRLDSEPSASIDSSSSQDDDELMVALDNTMDECFLLLKSGCPTAHVSGWLDSLVDKVPAMHRCAKYWLCRITIAQDKGQDANEIINIYEEAVREGAQPIQDVKDSLQQYVTELISSPPSPQAMNDASPAHSASVLEPRTPKGYKDTTVMTQLLQSSVLKYCLTESMSYFDRIRTAVGEQMPTTTPRLQLVTPVRRSTRLEGRRSILPLNLQDHDVCLASLDELPSSGPQEFILRTNRALEGEFSDEQDERLDPGLENE